MALPCEGIRVLDLSSGQVGGVCTMVLADFGADVVKVEPPGGDSARAETAAPVWLRGKRSITLDLSAPDGRATLAQLAAAADVVVASYAPGEAEAHGADYGTLAAENPALIYCSITGWGPRGLYAHYPPSEGLVAAKSGRMMAFSGQRNREGPGYAALPVATHAAAQGAVHGILAALIARENSGLGQMVETSLLQALMPYDLLQLLLTQLRARDPERFPDLRVVGGGMPTLNYHPVMTKEGRWIQFANLLEHLFWAFVAAADLTDLIVDERFSGQPASWDPDALEWARDRILERMQDKTADEWMAIFRENGNVAAEPFTTARDGLHHPDMVANGDAITINDPALGPVRQVGPVAHLTRTPASITKPAPRAGVDGLPDWAPRPLAPAGQAAPLSRPLEGFTILEFATIIATPLGVSMLADLGARVIKVEPVGGDPYRGMGLEGVMAAKTNAGKESICIELKSPEGQALVLDLIRNADAIIHNYRPGVPERLGIDYATATSVNPAIIWVSANGYGPNCPSARRPSAHPVPGAVAGGALYQAGAATPPARCESLAEIREASRQLMRANEANPDPNTAVVVASATLLAFLARQRFGMGQQVFVNMLAANAYANLDDFLEYEGRAPRPQVDAELHGIHALSRLYPAAVGWVFLGLRTQAEWEALCRATGREDLLADPRFADAAARAENDGALVAELLEVFATRDADTWEAVLIPAGAGCVRADAATPGEFFGSDPHVEANGFAPHSTHARLGTVKRWGPLTICDGGAPEYGPGILAGEHTDRILREIGRSDAEIAALRESNVVWSEPIGVPV